MTWAESNLDSLRSGFDLFLQQTVLSICPPDMPLLWEMVAYHFGWDKPHLNPSKRLRPQFVLLSAALFGGDLQLAMLPAVAIEVLHNYTLIHDDIEDSGESRHGRSSLWQVYGPAQALNTGDFLASSTHTILSRLEGQVSPDVLRKVRSHFERAGLGVTLGQHLDILSEKLPTISLAEYERLIELKTARLFEAAFGMGAVLAGATAAQEDALVRLGRNFGLGFQVLDDYLGIWAAPNETGKSTSTDLISRKKSFPILFGQEKGGRFTKLWNTLGVITEEDAKSLAELLSADGAEDVTREKALAYATSALKELNALDGKPDYQAALGQLIRQVFAPLRISDSS